MDKIIEYIKDNPVMTGILAAILLAVIVLIVVLSVKIARENKRKKAERNAPQEQPAPEPVTEEKPEPVVEAKPEPVPEKKPEPVPEKKPEPVAEAKPEPVVEKKPEPVVEAKPEPVAEAKPEPVPEKKPEPQREGNFIFVPVQKEPAAKEAKPKTAKPKPVKAAKPVEKKDDGAKPAKEEPVSGANGKWAVFEDGGRYGFRLIASNGEVMLESATTYSSLGGALAGVKTYQNNIKAGRLAIKETKNGFRVQVFNARGGLLAASADYKTRPNTESAMESIKRWSATAVVVQPEDTAN